MIASDSGPSLLPWIFGVPCLGVNIVNAQGMFPLRSRDLYIVKRLRRAPTGEAVALTEMLAPDFQRLLKRRLYKERTLEYVDNSPEEIFDAVRAMVQGLAAPAPSTPDQDRYGTLVDELRRQEHAQTKLLEKSGTAESFLGDGRIVASFAAQYLDGVRGDSRS